MTENKSGCCSVCECEKCERDSHCKNEECQCHTPKETGVCECKSRWSKVIADGGPTLCGDCGKPIKSENSHTPKGGASDYKESVPQATSTDEWAKEFDKLYWVKELAETKSKTPS